MNTTLQLSYRTMFTPKFARLVSLKLSNSCKPLQPVVRHTFTTREVREAVQSAMKTGYVASLLQRTNSGCSEGRMSLDGKLLIDVVGDDAGLFLHRFNEFMLEQPASQPPCQLALLQPPVTAESQTPCDNEKQPTLIAAPDTSNRLTPQPKECLAMAIVEEPDMAIDNEEWKKYLNWEDEEEPAGEEMPVNTAVYIKLCTRKTCERHRYKKGMCKTHYGAWRKKNPWN